MKDENIIHIIGEIINILYQQRLMSETEYWKLMRKLDKEGR